MNLKSLKLLLFSSLMMLLVSCGGGSSAVNSTHSSTINSTGFAQKGPFSVGSSVIITELDSHGIAISEPIESTVSSENGGFVFQTNSLSLNSYYRLQVKGTYFDESTGSISENPIVLTAITDNPQNSSVNLMTHWLSARTDVLLSKGKSLKESIDQAQIELFQLFGIKNSNILDVTASPSSLDADNAMLLLLSGSLMEASTKYEVSSQTIIEEIAVDIADDGKLSEKGDVWFLRLQALIKDNPKNHNKKYAKAIQDSLGYNISLENNLPALIPLASRPVANVAPELIAKPGETITLDGSTSHDSGDIINFTWFRVDQQSQYDIQVSDRFSASPTITVPDEATVLAAPNQQISLLYALVVTDAEKLTHTGVVKVIIKIPPQPNNPPEAFPQTIETNEDKPIAINLTANDTDGDPINFVLGNPISTVNGGIINLAPSLPNVLYTPANNYFGPDSFNFLVNDGFENSNIATITISVNPINDPPFAEPQNVTTEVEKAVVINLVGGDIDTDNSLLTYKTTLPSNGSFSGDLPNITYTPNTSFTGDDEFEFTVNDSALSSNSALVKITVEPAVISNQAPTANAGIDRTEPLLTTVNLFGSGTDDGTINAYQWVQVLNPGSTTVSISNSSSAIARITTPGFPEALIFALTVTDNEGLSSVLPDLVTITIDPSAAINTPPKADPFTVNLKQDSSVIIPQSTGRLAASDGDGDPVTIVDVSQPNQGVLNIETTPSGEIVYTYTPTAGYCGSDSFDYRAHDGHVVSDFARVTLVVNCQPITGGLGDITVDTSSVDILLSGTDSDGFIIPAPASYEILNPPQFGSFDPNFDLPQILYMPSGIPVPDKFTYRVFDNLGFASEPETVDLIVDNRAPIAVSDSLTFTSNTTIDLKNYASDPDGDPIQFEIIGVLPDFPIIFTTTSTFNIDGLVASQGLDSPVKDSFRFRVIDEKGAKSNIATIEVNY